MQSGPTFHKQRINYVLSQVRTSDIEASFQLWIFILIGLWCTRKMKKGKFYLIMWKRILLYVGGGGDGGRPKF